MIRQLTRNYRASCFAVAAATVAIVLVGGVVLQAITSAIPSGNTETQTAYEYYALGLGAYEV